MEGWAALRRARPGPAKQRQHQPQAAAGRQPGASQPLQHRGVTLLACCGLLFAAPIDSWRFQGRLRTSLLLSLSVLTHSPCQQMCPPPECRAPVRTPNEHDQLLCMLAARPAAAPANEAPARAGSRGTATEKEEARLRDAVLGEVLQSGSSVRWADVAGLASAKQVLFWLLLACVWAMTRCADGGHLPCRPDLCLPCGSIAPDCQQWVPNGVT